MPTSVVTGGAGFLGSHLCDYLLERGHRVICVDNLETSTLANLEHIRSSDFSFLYHDVVEHIDVPEPVDFVYHLAALASPIDYLRQPLHSLKVGSYGTHNALGLAKYKRARFFIASTSEVYGDPLQHPQQESYWGNVNPIGPRGVYDEAKRYAEAMTMAYHKQQGVDTCIARIFNTYGPKMRPNDGRAIPTFVRQALDDQPLTVFGDGSQTRSFCYVDDLIRGLVALTESGEHMPVNIGNPGSSRCSSWPSSCCGSRARRARSSTRRCPRTTRSSAGRTSRAQRSYSAGSRRSRSRKGSGASSKTTAASRGRRDVTAPLVAALGAGSSSAPGRAAAAAAANRPPRRRPSRRPSLTLSPSPVQGGDRVTVGGSAGDCTAGDPVTISSSAFPPTREFAGVPAVTATVHDDGSFSTTTAIPSTTQPGDYDVTARCGGGNLGLAL